MAFDRAAATLADNIHIKGGDDDDDDDDDDDETTTE
jgi:hypothetical protein